jgi:MFS family permease
LPLAIVPIVFVVMNGAYAGTAWPAGVLSDRIGRYGVVTAGFGVLILADLVLAIGSSIGLVMAGVVLWGLHMGLTQGLLSAVVADTAPAGLRGTAFGIFNLVSGLAMLAASIIAGAMWEVIGPDGTFLTGAAFAAVALTALPFVRWRAKLRGSN